MSTLDDRLRSAATAVHQQAAGLSIPNLSDEYERAGNNQRRSGRRIGAVAAAAVIVLVAALSVGLTRGGGSSSSGAGLTIEALAAATQQQSARVTITISVPTSLLSGLQPGAPKRSAFIEAGLVDFRNRVARITIEEATDNGPPKRIGTELLLDGYIYSSITAANAETIPPEIRRTKRWLKTTPQNSANPFSSLNPFDPLAQLREQHVELKDLGITSLGDHSVRQYHGTRVVSYTPPSSSGPRETLTVEFDIYVDSHNRLVRLTSTTKRPEIADGATTQIDFADYGVHVGVTAPPADQIYSPPNVSPNT